MTRPLGEQHSRFGQRNGGTDSPESGPLAEAPEGQITQTAELRLEQSRTETGEQRRSRGGARDDTTRPLGEQNSRFGQRNGGKY